MRFMSPRPGMHASEPRVGGRFFVLMQGDKPYPQGRT
jgi:hypothetical protein